MPPSRHPTLTQSFCHRASFPNTPPLAAYLLHLITVKKSNLCVSADISSTAALLQLAEDVGDSICVLKTHADIVDDWNERTIRRLKEISRQKGFLLFEDRKFGDIGSTVQRQYTSGHHRIATWAPLTNAHIFPGPALITALQTAALATLTSLNQSVSTEISAGTPRSSSDYSEHSHPSSDNDNDDDNEERAEAYSASGRKRSIVTATTISQYTEHTHPPRLVPRSVPDNDDDDDDDDDEEGDVAKRMARLGDAPVARGLLLLAEMSSEGNLLTGEYTQRCVHLARQHRDFVLGFIAQHSLNTEPEDNFITFTPGVSLPPAEEEDAGQDNGGSSSGKEKKRGDGLGQQYNTPRKMVLEEGCDIVIVGRGILGASDRRAEAERYRREAWGAYEERVVGRRK
ncbi:MAG: orotidine 5'-phosphate decarboxylase [Pleopsidium flavum]|nr:MAG: orotidine 5'-phosphate decarboxylase [Pleopsidium flavum]